MTAPSPAGGLGTLRRLRELEVAGPPSAPAVRFGDRRDAGRRLAALLEGHRGRRPVIVAMPRGGVPVAAEVARELQAPLDIAVVRKIGAPQNPEFALGAVAENAVRVVNASAVHTLGLTHAAVAELVDRAEEELAVQVRRYRTRPATDLSGRTAILVDDGLATGLSAHAALLSLRRRGAVRLILAVPVAAPESVRALRSIADAVVCVEQPERFRAVGCWYEDFAPASDAEVVACLEEAAGRRTRRQADPQPHPGQATIGATPASPQAAGARPRHPGPVRAARRARAPRAGELLAREQLDNPTRPSRGSPKTEAVMTRHDTTITVADVMTTGAIDAAPQTPLLEVAARMAERRVHCVIVDGLARGRRGAEELVWGIVSDLDLLSAVAAGRLDASAGEMAATEIVTIEPSEPIEQAARLMAQHECTHLVVVSDDARPVGVLSSLDIAGALSHATVC